jgi:low temperature requirement protein LtrA
LYDLTIVVAIGTAANELADYVAAGHIGVGVVGFAFATFAIIWAWVNYSWFASAYDTDDWVFRLATMVQMVGVIVLALGLQQMFASIERGAVLDNGVMVAGYVVMRVSMLFLWSQVARDDPRRSLTAKIYMKTIACAQVGWVALALLRLPIGAFFVIAAGLIGIEFCGPWLAEGRGGTPWHPEHIAERYGLLVIITLGEGIIGTVAALNLLVHSSAGWTGSAVLVAIAGVGLTFGAWWTYFAVPWADLLTLHRQRAFTFGYGHIVLFASLAAIGAGMRVASFFLGHRTTIGPVATVLTVAIPIAIFILAVFTIYSLMMREVDRFHLALLAGTGGVLAAAIVLAAAGVGVPTCLLVVMLAPIVTVVGFELLGHRHLSAALARGESAGSPEASSTSEAAAAAEAAEAAGAEIV